MNDTSLAVRLKKVETLLSQAMVMMSEMRRELDDAKPATKKSGPSSTSAVAVTVKKDGKGRKMSHSDSDDESYLSQAMVTMSEMRHELDDAKPAAKKSGPSSTSAVAVTVKKGKGRKMSHSDSNDESNSPDY